MRVWLLLLLAHAYSLNPLEPKLCKNCKFFAGDTLECKKFGDTNLVTGEVTNRYARFIRENECGKNAIYFEKNNLKIVTVPYYFVKRYWWATGYILFVVGYGLVSLK